MIEDRSYTEEVAATREVLGRMDERLKALVERMDHLNESFKDLSAMRNADREQIDLHDRRLERLEEGRDSQTKRIVAIVGAVAIVVSTVISAIITSVL